MCTMHVAASFQAIVIQHVVCGGGSVRMFWRHSIGIERQQNVALILSTRSVLSNWWRRTQQLIQKLVQQQNCVKNCVSGHNNRSNITTTQKNKTQCHTFQILGSLNRLKITSVITINNCLIGNNYGKQLCNSLLKSVPY